MTDLETIKAMFDRVGVGYDENTPEEYHDAAKAGGATSLGVGDFVAQPHQGGYMGFWTEFVFDADGELLAVWAWE